MARKRVCLRREDPEGDPAAETKEKTIAVSIRCGPSLGREAKKVKEGKRRSKASKTAKELLNTKETTTTNEEQAHV